MKGANELEKALNGLLEGISEAHIKTLTADLAESLKNRIEQSFEQERSPAGTGWMPRKTGKDSARKILVRSGNLSNLWATESSETHFKAFSPAKSKDGKPYGLFHQFGTKKMVARPFLPLNKENSAISEQMGQELLNEVQEYFARACGGK